MSILVHVTDSDRPTDAFVTYPLPSAVRGIVAAAEGMAAPVLSTDDLTRHRHRKARRQARRWSLGISRTNRDPNFVASGLRRSRPA